MFAEIDEVVRRLQVVETVVPARPTRKDGAGAGPVPADDPVDAASRQSFPASDPPGWIGGGPD